MFNYKVEIKGLVSRHARSPVTKDNSMRGKAIAGNSGKTRVDYLVHGMVWYGSI